MLVTNVSAVSVICCCIIVATTLDTLVISLQPAVTVEVEAKHVSFSVNVMTMNGLTHVLLLLQTVAVLQHRPML